MTTLYWTASNNSSFLNGYRTATSMTAAVRDARRYVRNELYGAGKINFFDAAPEEGLPPCRIDECSIYTGNKWQTLEII